MKSSSSMKLTRCAVTVLLQADTLDQRWSVCFCVTALILLEGFSTCSAKRFTCGRSSTVGASVAGTDRGANEDISRNSGRVQLSGE